jgi:hypothetical protein
LRLETRDLENEISDTKRNLRSSLLEIQDLETEDLEASNLEI